MGIVFEEVAKQIKPSYGAEQVATLAALLNLARSLPSAQRTTMVDCINVRYRSKAYRDHMIACRDTGHVSDNQLDEIKHLLNGVRHNRRTPGAKAFRRLWP